MIKEEKMNVSMKETGMDKKTSGRLTGREKSSLGPLSDKELDSVAGGVSIWEVIKEGAKHISFAP